VLNVVRPERDMSLRPEADAGFTGEPFRLTIPVHPPAQTATKHGLSMPLSRPQTPLWQLLRETSQPNRNIPPAPAVRENLIRRQIV